MANVSKINFNGEALDIKDTHAREQILHLTADNYTADVTGDYTVNAGDIAMTSANATMHTTADRTIDTDGNDSVHIDGASTMNVGGLRTETFAGDKTEAVTGTSTEKAGNRNTTVTGKWAVNLPGKSFDMKDVALKSDIDGVKQYTNFVVIGDSFSTDLGTGTPLWYKYVEKQTGLTAYVTAVDGAGYTRFGKNDFKNQAWKAASALDVRKVKTVYLFGGLNDIGDMAVTTESFKTEVNTTLDEVIKVFPHSEIVVAGIQPFQNYNFYSGDSCLPDGRALDFQTILISSCATHGVKFIDLSTLGLFNKDYFGPASGTNQKHPSSIGSAIIASSILSGYAMAQGLEYTGPELKPTIDNGTIECVAHYLNSRQIYIRMTVRPTSADFHINWNGWPYSPDYLPLSIPGGDTIVGYYYMSSKSVITFNNATPGLTYHGYYIINM